VSYSQFTQDYRELSEVISPLRFYIFGSTLSLLLSQQLYAQAYIPGANVNGIHVEQNSPSVLPEKILFKILPWSRVCQAITFRVSFRIVKDFYGREP